MGCNWGIAPACVGMSHKVELVGFLQKLAPITRPDFPYNKEAICSRHATFAEFAKQVCKDAEEKTKARQHSRSGASHFVRNALYLTLSAQISGVCTSDPCNAPQVGSILVMFCLSTSAVGDTRKVHRDTCTSHVCAMMICRFTDVSWGSNRWHAYLN